MPSVGLAAIFGLHVVTQPVGTILYREGPAMAASDRMRIVVQGVQTHGAYPWLIPFDPQRSFGGYTLPGSEW